MKTFMAKKSDVKRDWYVIDAENQTLGRLASKVATILRGKHKAIYTPHVDCGDYVIVINAEKVKITGNKLLLLSECEYRNRPALYSCCRYRFLPQ